MSQLNIPESALHDKHAPWNMQDLRNDEEQCFHCRDVWTPYPDWPAYTEILHGDEVTVCGNCVERCTMRVRGGKCGEPVSALGNWCHEHELAGLLDVLAEAIKDVDIDGQAMAWDDLAELFEMPKGDVDGFLGR